MADPQQIVDAINDNTVGVVGGTFASLIALIVAYFKVMKTINQDRKESYSDTATNEVMQRLVAEIDRLTLQNTTLSNLVHSMQLEIIKLREENAEIKLLFVKETHGKVNPPTPK